MDIEQWLGVPGFIGYEVSNLGRIRSFKGTGGRYNTPSKIPRIIKSSPNSKGYPVHSFLNGKVRKTFTLHRLVAELFVPGKRQGVEVSHLDGDRLNCRADNLVWESHRENMLRQEAHETSPVGSRNARAKLSLSQVTEIERRASEGESFSALAKEFSVTYQTIRDIKIGKTWRRRI